MPSTHESFLVYKRLRWFWLALSLGLLSLALYIWHDPVDSPNGGTWLGYSLGTLGAGLILWLMWLGIRKRRYNGGSSTLKGWLSAHVYLGLCLLFIGTLHAGFQFGWNVHTLAYTFMCLVIVSGIFGVIVYARYPALVAGNRDARTRATLLAEIEELDQQALNLATELDSEIAHAVDDAVQNTRLGGGVLQQLRGRDRSSVALQKKRQSNAGQQALIRWLAQRSAAAGDGGNNAQIQNLIDVISAKRHITERLRTDMRLQGWLKVWLYVHIPIAFGLLAALAAHIVAVFAYW